MMRRVLLRLWLIGWLVLVWVLLWGNISVANILSGLALAALITVLLPLPMVPVQGRVHPLSLLRLAVTVAWSLVVSSVQVAWLAIRPGPPPRTAVLRSQVNIKSDLVLALAAGIHTVIPGSVVLQIDRDRRMLYLHVLNVGSEKALAQFYRQQTQIERLLIAAFERDTEWRSAPEENHS